MTEEIKRRINNFLNLEQDDLNLLLSNFKLIKLNKGDIFLEIGQKSHFVGYIIKGCLIGIYNHCGREVIEEFSWENEFIADYQNLFESGPSEKYVKCIEDVEILVIDTEKLKELYNLRPSFERIGRLIAESLLKKWINKTTSLMLDDAENRYINLLKNRPKIIQRVPQYLVASYLGVAPQSLSRIKKNIQLTGSY